LKAHDLAGSLAKPKNITGHGMLPVARDVDCLRRKQERRYQP
jgi:hypothetical protein